MEEEETLDIEGKGITSHRMCIVSHRICIVSSDLQMDRTMHDIEITKAHLMIFL